MGKTQALVHSKNICPLLFLSKEEEGAYIF